MLKFYAQHGCISVKIYILQVFMAGKDLGELAAFTFNFTD